MKKTIILKTNGRGETDANYGNGWLSGRIEEQLDLEAHQYIICDFTVIPQGYRPVTEDEKSKYKKPAKHWILDKGVVNEFSNKNWFLYTSWADGIIYVVPDDYTFKDEWVTPTDEDALTRPIVEVREYETNEWQEDVLLAVIEDNTRPFVAKGDDYAYCRMNKSKRRVK